MGAILFELLTKQPPFTGGNHLELLANIERHEAVLPPGISASKECRTLIDRLLRRNPHMRMSFQVGNRPSLTQCALCPGLPPLMCLPVCTCVSRPAALHLCPCVLWALEPRVVVWDLW